MADDCKRADKPTIDRRDFLQGAAVAIGAVAAPAAAKKRQADLAVDGPDKSALPPLMEEGISQQDPRYYPPGLTGMRGSHPGSFQTAHQIRDAGQWTEALGEDRGERYDLIVVGAGISGLSAAYSFRKNNPNARILVLDNHDDIGGHAKRNEFQVGDRKLIGYGGTQTMSTDYPPEALSLFSEVGIDMRRFRKYWKFERDVTRELQPGVFFDRETFGADKTIRGLSDNPSPEMWRDAPIADQAKTDLARLYSGREDFLAGMTFEEKRDYLRQTSFKQFLIDKVKAHPDVVKYFDASPCELNGLGSDVTSAWIVIAQGTWLPTYPAFLCPLFNLSDAMHLGMTPVDGYGYICHFPDGNASVARSLARGLIPDALPGSTMEDLVTSRLNYAKLDDPASNVRIRLNSTVARVQHLGDPATSRQVIVTYVMGNKPYLVTADHVILACYNMIIPRLMPELPEKQKEALLYQVKVPLVYINVAIRNSQALQKLGLNQIYCPGSLFYSICLDFAVSIGDYQTPMNPDEPCILHIVAHIPTDRSLSPRDQRRAARMFLYQTPFETFEQKIRDQLDRALGPGGFDSERDIVAITVNRWPHGYADNLSGMDDPKWGPGQAPNEIGRERFGRVSIANSDAAASAETGSAAMMGIRAAKEQNALRG